MDITNRSKRALLVVGLLDERWTPAVPAQLTDGGRRYRDLHDASDGISHKVLADTRRRSERDGIVTRYLDPERVEGPKAAREQGATAWTTTVGVANTRSHRNPAGGHEPTPRSRIQHVSCERIGKGRRGIGLTPAGRLRDLHRRSDQGLRRPIGGAVPGSRRAPGRALGLRRT
ncbi:MAG: winged helix-turn-helix transcriptional regulator [Acidimicrobiales bacterium]